MNRSRFGLDATSDFQLHMFLILATCGVWLLFLPFVLLFERLERILEAIVGAVLRAAWAVITAPFRAVVAIWRATRN